MQRARFDGVGSAIGLTPNETLNGLFVTRAREFFNVPRAYVALEGLAAGVTAEVVRSQDAEILFETPHDVERWDVRSRHGDMEVTHLQMRKLEEGEVADDEAEAPKESFLILAIRRGEHTFPMSTTFKLKEGDVAAVAMHVQEREEALRALARRGWDELPASKGE